MPPRVIPLPSRRALGALLVLAALLLVLQGLGVPRQTLLMTSLALLALFVLGLLADGLWTWQAWRRSPLQWRRSLPNAFALGVLRELHGELVNTGPQPWRATLFDRADPDLDAQGLPLTVELGAASSARLRYRVYPRRRGRVVFEPADLRLQSLGGSLELQLRIGESEARPVLPNFAAVARYAWLATDRRLADIGIKTQVQRGEGTDFKQLAEYQLGDSTRHIDWKATLKRGRPIVRQFQDERDQRVMFLLDCGRRMRADEDDPRGVRQASHFDEALNALMLLAHVALTDGDEVGAMTFGHASADQARALAPRKGRAALAALTTLLHDIQPEATHSDYLLAARDLMRRCPKRSLVVLVTNFRDEDVPELQDALRLLRSRHLVLLASLRERVLRELAEQPITRPEHAVEVAAAHAFEQARRDAFRRVSSSRSGSVGRLEPARGADRANGTGQGAQGRDALMVDAEPQRLAVELVNRYRAVKRAGLL